MGGHIDAPPAPLPVQGPSQLEVDPPPPPRGAPAGGGGGGGGGGWGGSDGHLLQPNIFQGYPPMGDVVRGLQPNFGQGFPSRGGSVRVGRVPRQLLANMSLSSWVMNIVAPWVRGVGG